MLQSGRGGSAGPRAAKDDPPARRWDARTKTGARNLSETRRTMVLVAKAYYFENKSRVQIAQELGISRFKVARCLTEARASGMISITLNSGAAMPELSLELSRHLGLRDVRVVEVYGDAESIRNAVGRATGTWLRETLKEGESLGLGWGRTLNSMIDDLDHLPQVEIIQLSGRFGGDVRNSAAELSRRAVALTGGAVRAIAAPFFVDDAHEAIVLRRRPDVATVVEGFDDLTTAVVGIGAMSPSPISVAYSEMPERFTELVRTSGAVGEVCGILFAADGHAISSGLWRHTLTITSTQLRRANRVIAAATAAEKADAVRAVCCSGVLTDLVVDIELAHALLALPPIPAEVAGDR